MELVGADEGSIQLLRPTSSHSRRTLIRSGEKGKGCLDSRLDDLLTGRAVMHKQVLLTTILLKH